MKSGTFIVISDVWTYPVHDTDLRFTLARLIAGERQESRRYREMHKDWGEVQRECLRNGSKARIKGFRIAMNAVQVSRDLRREMEREMVRARAWLVESVGSPFGQ